jgi:membrane fusion protein (multidrug efflux system)
MSNEETNLPPTEAPAGAPIAESGGLMVDRRAAKKRKYLLIAIGAVVVLAAIFGIPRLIYVWHHESTDDAIVNSHVTYLSPRVGGMTEAVLVDDNQYVEAGTVLVRLDRQPYELEAEQAEAALGRARLDVQQHMAALAVARAQLEQTRTGVRTQISKLRANWYLVASVQDFVRFATASLRSSVATLQQKKAVTRLAQQEYDRATHLGTQAVSQEEIDQRKSALDAARADEAASEQSVQQARALLGLPPDEKDPGSVPANVTQSFNGTQYAVASFQESLASLGIRFDLMSPQLGDLRDKFLTMNEDQTVEQSPSVRTASAQVAASLAWLGGESFDPAHPEKHPEIVEAQRQVDQAKLHLAYTEIRAPLAGFVSRRSVNPGAVVQAGQSLMTIRPLQDVWVDANFKETQLANLKIGQSVELYVDAYPDKIFHGRVSGFSPGTGAVMSLLPPENATGNFVKVVQRLPVRIELTEANPKDTPLFAGLSVEPEVDISAAPQGQDAGQRLLGAANMATDGGERKP